MRLFDITPDDLERAARAEGPVATASCAPPGLSAADISSLLQATRFQETVPAVMAYVPTGMGDIYLD